MSEDNPPLNIKVDYGISWKQAYRNVAVAFVQNHKHIGILCLFNPMNGLSPSWVPNWRRLEISKPNLWHLHWCGNWEVYNACGQNSIINAHVSEDILTVDGIKLSNVAMVGHACGNESLTGDFVAHVEAFAKANCTAYTTPDEFEEAVWRTCIADLTYGPDNDGTGITFKRATSETRDTYRIVRQPSHLDDLLDNKHKFPWYGRIMKFRACIACYNFPTMRLLASDSGYLGFGPEDMGNGDMICVLHGAKIQFILRCDSNTNHFRLVGPTYLHGNMDGEYSIMNPPMPTTQFHIR
jgi:hypothetical protein